MKINFYKNTLLVIKRPFSKTFSCNIINTTICLSLTIFIIGASGVMTAKGQIKTQTEFDSTAPMDKNLKTFPSETQKIVTSSFIHSSAKNQSNDTNRQYATILPTRGDDSIYYGIVTFTSNQPVKIQIFHSFRFDNLSLYDKQSKEMILQLYNSPNATSLIIPDYRSSNQFSASIPFAGKGVVFLSEKPFVAVYTVAVSVEKRNITSGPTSNESEVSSFEPPGTYNVNSGSLLIEAIPHIPNEILQELPFSNLSSSDISTILNKVPYDKGSIILDKIPLDKRQEILDKIPLDKRQEILKND